MKRLVKVILLVLVTVVLTGLVWFVAPWSTVPQANEVLPQPLKFAVMSDIHSDLPNLTKALAQAKADGAEFVILTGDLTNVGSTKELEEVKKVLDASGLTYYAIPGNHDYWQSRNLSQPLFKQAFGSNYLALTNLNDHWNLSVGYKLVLIDNGDDYGGLGKEQWAWLERELTVCHQVRCLVFMHEPLNHPTSEHIMGEGHAGVASEAATLRQEMFDAGVRDLFAGHLHSSHHYTLDGLTTWIVGSAALERNWQTPRFLEVTIGETLEEKEVVF